MKKSYLNKLGVLKQKLKVLKEKFFLEKNLEEPSFQDLVNSRKISKRNKNKRLFRTLGEQSKYSIVFMNANYYIYEHFSKKLREKGWDAICVNLESHRGNMKWYGDFDYDLYSSNKKEYYQNLIDFYNVLRSKRFKLLWFYGKGFRRCLREMFT